jgi:hypothetical protein
LCQSVTAALFAEAALEHDVLVAGLAGTLADDDLAGGEGLLELDDVGADGESAAAGETGDLDRLDLECELRSRETRRKSGM